MADEKIDITIIILSKNEENNIRNCLSAVFSQRVSFKYEVLLIDSGSTDQTVEIAKNFKDVKIVSIKPEEFGHGKTRNFGAKMAKGRYVVFLNADAIPQGDNWLESLILPLKEERVAAAFSRHIPKKGCFQYMVRDLSKPMVFSTVSASIKKEVLNKFPFDDSIAIAEDLEWAIRVKTQGYKIIYQPLSCVEHSHNYSAKELFKIKYLLGKETTRTIYKGRRPVRSVIFCLGQMIFKIFGDIIYIFRQDISFFEKIKEIFISFIARVSSFSGRLLGELSK